MGKLGSSDVTSTVAICSRSSQPCSDSRLVGVDGDPTILFRIILFLRQHNIWQFHIAGLITNRGAQRSPVTRGQIDSQLAPAKAFSCFPSCDPWGNADVGQF